LRLALALLVEAVYFGSITASLFYFGWKLSAVDSWLVQVVAGIGYLVCLLVFVRLFDKPMETIANDLRRGD